MNSVRTKQSMAGTVVEGKYLLERELGVGGMGQVFLARDTIIDRQVAIKVLHKSLADDESVRQRFTTEAKAIARLRHPNCVMLYDFGISNDLDALFAVFEYVEGDSLEKWVGQQCPIGAVLELGRQIASGMDHAHGQKIIHRDLKPENVMVLVGEKGDLEFKILDFGIARITEDGPESQRLTKAGQLFGTPPYMSPEQIKAKLNVGHSTDIYSIGVILYELIEGKLPFLGAAPIETVMMHLNEPVPPMTRAKVPEELRQIVMRCLEKKPEDRFADCRALGKAIAAVPWDDEKDGASVGNSALPEANPVLATMETELEFSAESTRVEAPPQVAGGVVEEVARAQTMLTDQPAESPAVQLRGAVASAPEELEADRMDTVHDSKGSKKRKALIAILLLVVLVIGGSVTVALILGGGDLKQNAGEPTPGMVEPLNRDSSESVVFVEEIDGADDREAGEGGQEEQKEVREEEDFEGLEEPEEHLPEEEAQEEVRPAAQEPIREEPTRVRQPVRRTEPTTQEETAPTSPEPLRLDRRRRTQEEQDSPTEEEERSEPAPLRLRGR